MGAALAAASGGVEGRRTSGFYKVKHPSPVSSLRGFDRADSPPIRSSFISYVLNRNNRLPPEAECAMLLQSPPQGTTTH